MVQGCARFQEWSHKTEFDKVFRAQAHLPLQVEEFHKETRLVSCASVSFPGDPSGAQCLTKKGIGRPWATSALGMEDGSDMAGIGACKTHRTMRGRSGRTSGMPPTLVDTTISPQAAASTWLSRILPSNTCQNKPGRQ